MIENDLIRHTLDGEEVFYLKGGTDYLPTIYIKQNKHLGKWMVFESEHHEVVSNRTFLNKKACIDFINSYDKQTRLSLDALYESIQNPALRELAKQVDFAKSTQLTPLPTSDKFARYQQQQLRLIQQKYRKADIQLVASFCDGRVSLYSSHVDSNNECVFYLCDGDTVSSYKSWKTFSVAKALFQKLNSCECLSHSNSNDITHATDSVPAEANSTPHNQQQFEQDTLDGQAIYRLHGGTKYLPSIYIKYNTHWNKWMIFEGKTHHPISNRTFNSQQDCIDFINSYDEQSESTLTLLRNEIQDKKLRAIVENIDFSNPQQVIKVSDNSLVQSIIDAQKSSIASIYGIDKEEVQLISYFFDGVIALYTNNAKLKDELMFYVFDNGISSAYTPWKTVSLAIVLFQKLVEYDREQHKYEHLEDLIGKSLIDDKGNGFYFVEHITDTSFMYVQKVHVDMVNGINTAMPELPLAPSFIANVKMETGLLTLHVKNHFIDMENEKEVYSFEIVGG